MKRDGFSFIECILAIGILSIVAATILPVTDTSVKQFSSITVKNELRKIAQSTIEILKSNDTLSNELLVELENSDYIEVETDYINPDYKCTVYKLYNSKKLMEVEVRVSNYKDKDVEEVVLKASIKK